MGILPKAELQRLYDEKILTITSTVEGLEFNPKEQIQATSIDLRLGTEILKYKSDKVIDILANQTEIDLYFEAVPIPIEGYIIEPGETVFSYILEAILLATDRYIGRVIGRTTWARFGLSITCSQPNLPPGIAWTFPLQITNLSKNRIKIYPCIYIAQLQIESIEGTPVPYNGKFDNYFGLPYPRVTDREREALHNAKRLSPLRIDSQNTRLEKVLEEFKESENQHLFLRAERYKRILRNLWGWGFLSLSILCFANIKWLFLNFLSTAESLAIGLALMAITLSPPSDWIIRLAEWVAKKKARK